MAYGHILSKTLLSRFRKGCFNLHASLLPALRGPSPIETSIAIGLQETGVTLMEMVARLDAGPIIDQGTMPHHTGRDRSVAPLSAIQSLHSIDAENLSKLADHSYRLL